MERIQQSTEDRQNTTEEYRKEEKRKLEATHQCKIQTTVRDSLSRRS
jgi:hypothetical protein